jgi:hypothetical protein
METISDDPLGDRMKEYEMAEAGRRALPGLPTLARLDGKAFHTFTKGLERPYDGRLHALMDATTRHLVKESGALVGYTQSDEISLLFYAATPRAEPFLGGRFQKLTSILAAMATAFFNRQLAQALPEKAERLPIFDCRAWVVPSLEEAANTCCGASRTPRRTASPWPRRPRSRTATCRARAPASSKSCCSSVTASTGTTTRPAASAARGFAGSRSRAASRRTSSRSCRRCTPRTRTRGCRWSGTTSCRWRCRRFRG